MKLPGYSYYRKGKEVFKADLNKRGQLARRASREMFKKELGQEIEYSQIRLMKSFEEYEALCKRLRNIAFGACLGWLAFIVLSISLLMT